MREAISSRGHMCGTWTTPSPLPLVSVSQVQPLALTAMKRLRHIYYCNNIGTEALTQHLRCLSLTGVYSYSDTKQLLPLVSPL